MKEYNGEMCDERHDNIKETFERLFREVSTVSKRLTWFLILVVGTLATAIANLVIK